MRFGPDDKLWVVTDPGPESTVEDILFEASLRDLELQFKGGLTMDDNPTLFTERAEAEVEAYGRMVALRASQAISRGGSHADLREASRLEIRGRDGEVVFDAYSDANRPLIPIQFGHRFRRNSATDSG